MLPLDCRRTTSCSCRPSATTLAQHGVVRLARRGPHQLVERHSGPPSLVASHAPSGCSSSVKSPVMRSRSNRAASGPRASAVVPWSTSSSAPASRYSWSRRAQWSSDPKAEDDAQPTLGKAAAHLDQLGAREGFVGLTVAEGDEPRVGAVALQVVGVPAVRGDQGVAQAAHVEVPGRHGRSPRGPSSRRTDQEQPPPRRTPAARRDPVRPRLRSPGLPATERATASGVRNGWRITPSNAAPGQRQRLRAHGGEQQAGGRDVGSLREAQAREAACRAVVVDRLARPEAAEDAGDVAERCQSRRGWRRSRATARPPSVRGRGAKRPSESDWRVWPIDASTIGWRSPVCVTPAAMRTARSSGSALRPATGGPSCRSARRSTRCRGRWPRLAAPGPRPHEGRRRLQEARSNPVGSQQRWTRSHANSRLLRTEPRPCDWMTWCGPHDQHKVLP